MTTQMHLHQVNIAVDLSEFDLNTQAQELPC